MLPNQVVWFVGVDVEFILSCRFDPLGRYGNESEQETLDSVCGLYSKEDSQSAASPSHTDLHTARHGCRTFPYAP